MKAERSLRRTLFCRSYCSRGDEMTVIFLLVYFLLNLLLDNRRSFVPGCLPFYTFVWSFDMGHGPNLGPA